MAVTIKRARRVVDLVTDLSLQEQYTQALRDLDAARAGQSVVAMEVGESSAVRDAAAHVQELEAAMAASTLRFTLEAVQRLRWNEHIATHPPREGNPQDEAQGVNVESLDALIPESIKAVHDADGKPVDFDPRTEWAPLSTEISDGQWSDFISELIAVNRGSGAPKSQVASLVMRRSGKS